jgi:hypothetical protein
MLVISASGVASFIMFNIREDSIRIIAVLIVAEEQVKQVFN